MAIFVSFWKRSYFNPIGSHSARARSHLKELDFYDLKANRENFDCSILLLTIKVQNTFKILHYGVKF